METDQIAKKKMNRSLLLFNIVFLAIGNCGGPLIMRLYFIHGGKKEWLSSWLQTGGWPINFIPLIITYLHRRTKQGSKSKLFYMKSPVFVAAAVIGVLTGFVNYLSAFGVARLPVSTTTLLSSSQLCFTALFAYFFVRQKFTSYSINSVFLLTVGAIVLALHTSSDRPKGISSREYFLGFLTTIGAAALYGFVLPLVELTYKKAKQTITNTLVMEIQLVMCFFSTVFCTIGMVINKDFQAISKEAREFDLGQTIYYVVLVCSSILWQCFFLGTIGVIFSASSLLSAIIIAVLFPVTEILAVILYHEKFQAEKGVSLVLSIWGFVSYFYEELKHKKKIKTQTPVTEMPQTINAL